MDRIYKENERFKRRPTEQKIKIQIADAFYHLLYFSALALPFTVFSLPPVTTVNLFFRTKQINWKFIMNVTRSNLVFWIDNLTDFINANFSVAMAWRGK